MNPYLALGGLLAFLAAAVGGYEFGLHHQAAIDNAAIAEQKAEAATLLASETTKAAAKERENAELNATLEKVRTDADAKTAAADASVADAMRALRLRQQAGRRSGCQNPGGPPASPGGPADAAPGSDDRLSSALDADHRECARQANFLAAWVRECHAKINSMTCEVQ